VQAPSAALRTAAAHRRSATAQASLPYACRSGRSAFLQDRIFWPARTPRPLFPTAPSRTDPRPIIRLAEQKKLVRACRAMGRRKKSSGSAELVLNGRLREAIGLALDELEPRSGDPQVVRESVTRLVVAVGRRKPEASASDLKAIVLRLLVTTPDEIETPPTAKRKPPRS
jgi:hypothetical protein